MNGSLINLFANRLIVVFCRDFEFSIELHFYCFSSNKQTLQSHLSFGNICMHLFISFNIHSLHQKRILHFTFIIKGSCYLYNVNFFLLFPIITFIHSIQSNFTFPLSFYSQLDFQSSEMVKQCATITSYTRKIFIFKIEFIFFIAYWAVNWKIL